MNTKHDFGPEALGKTVYVRPVEVASLPDEVREQAGDIDTLYALHGPDGERLALVRDVLGLHEQPLQVLYTLTDDTRLPDVMNPRPKGRGL